MSGLTHEMFSPHVGSTFQLSVTGQAPLSLELVEVEKLPLENQDPQASKPREPFSLIFHGPLNPVVPQQIVDLKHAKLGGMQMFVVAIGNDQNSIQKTRYQAVFS